MAQIKMIPEKKNKQIAEKIIDLLRSGLAIGADTQHYIDSTFSNPTVDKLEVLLQNESSCETESLMALLFFPDESVQTQLEEMIEDAHLQKRDEREIQDRVCSTPIRTQIRFADGRGTLAVEVPPAAAAQFVERLNLSRMLDPKLKAAIARCVPRALQARCKVRLRNSAPVTAPRKVSFLQLFFEKLQTEEDEFLEHLDFVLGFVHDLKDETDIYRQLMARKKFYFQSLQKAAILDARLAKYNVETLLLGGKRVAYVDKADARRKIQMIDRICLALFDKTDLFDLMPTDEQSITLDGKEDIDRLIKELG